MSHVQTASKQVVYDKRKDCGNKIIYSNISLRTWFFKHFNMSIQQFSIDFLKDFFILIFWERHNLFATSRISDRTP